MRNENLFEARAGSATVRQQLTSKYFLLLDNGSVTGRFAFSGADRVITQTQIMSRLITT